jgi:hypothetical protein
MMRVLLVGNGQPYQIGSFFRRGLECLGYDYHFLDEAQHFKGATLIHRVAYRALGRRPLQYWSFNRTLLQQTIQFRPHVILVIKGPFVSPRVLRRIKAETGAILMNYATDDPFNPVNSTRTLREGIPLYDVYATPRKANLADLRRAGCRNPIFVRFGYDPAVHYPERPAHEAERSRWASDVVFAGGADQDRLPYLAALARLPGLVLHLYGGYWGRSKTLRSYWRGIAQERDYRLALGSSKMPLCLVRQANRDGHVMRTFEIPACGAFMLAERTDEHLELFEEGKEMACFASPEELVEKVRYYLAHDEERQGITVSGYRRVTTEPHTYQDRLVDLLRLAHAA